jgi:prophage tail gpP-like protein
MSEVKLTVSGEEFSIWQDYSIDSSLLNVPSAFSLRAPNNNGEMAGKVAPGMQVQLIVDGEQQLKGYIDEVRYDCDPDSGASVEISGRDVGLFLQDCCPLPQVIRNKTLLQIAEQLSETWITSWTCSETLEKIKYLKIEPGQTIIDILLEQARKNNLLIWIEPDGTGVIGKPDYEQEQIYELHRHPRTSEYRVLNNIISGSVSSNWTDRYTYVTVYGSQGGTQANYAKSVRSKATAIDDSDTWSILDRQLIVNDSNVKNLKQATALAELEVARRKFDGQILEYTLKDHYGYWADADGTKHESLFAINKRASVFDEISDIKGIYYVVRRTFRCDDNGKFTDIELRPDSVWLT